jgi:hypothetical protein
MGAGRAGLLGGAGRRGRSLGLMLPRALPPGTWPSLGLVLELPPRPWPMAPSIAPPSAAPAGWNGLRWGREEWRLLAVQLLITVILTVVAWP